MPSATVPSETVLDHLVVGVPLLEDGVTWLEEATGVRAAPGGRHERWGTHNALAAFGDGAYLELIARDPDAAAGSTPLPFGLATVYDEPRLIGWAARTADIDATVRRARAGGYDAGQPVAMQRRTGDGRVLSWRLTTNTPDGGPVPFLIDWGATPHPSTTAPTGLELTRFVLAHPEPEALRTWLRALGVEAEVEEASSPGLVAEVRGPAGALALR